MAVLQKILSFIWTILLLVGKLLCLTVRLVLKFIPAGIAVGSCDLPCRKQHIKKGTYQKCIGSGTDPIQCHA